MPLTIHVPEKEFYDESNCRFVKIKGGELLLEHSLISLKRWEQVWNKPFLGKNEKTNSEIRSYIKCMTINSVDPSIYLGLDDSQVAEIVDYIKAPMTATWFSSDTIGAQRNRNEVITAEIIYWWMIALQIPVEFQKWHLNSLLTLIKVVNEKQKPDKKMQKNDAAAQRRALNAARRKRYNSRG